jgi:parvulin-like peptidyl-prolyl isomerase
MLDIMRRQPLLIYPIFGGIILMFALSWGPGQASCDRPQDLSWAAKVDGEVVRQHDFVRLYSQQMDYLQRLAKRSGQSLSPEMAERMGLPKQVIDSLVETKILAQDAQRYGLVVDDAALREELRERFGFSRFSYSEYEDIVSQRFDTTVSRFEEERRGELGARQLARLLSGSLTVSDAELRQAFVQQHDRLKAQYVRFDPQPQQVPPPSEAVLDKLLAEEPAALEQQYAKDVELYRTPAQMHLRQIMLPLPAASPAAAADDPEADDDADDAAVDPAAAALAAAQESLGQVQQELAAGADFATLAAKYAVGADAADSNAAGSQAGQDAGDLGWVSETDLAPPLAAAVRELPAGSLTPQPVRSSSGLHLLQVIERREAETKELPAVRREVGLALYKGRLAAAAAQRTATALLQRLTAAKGADSAALWSRLTVDEAAAEGSLAGASELLRSSGRSIPAKPQRRLTSWFVSSDASIPRIGTAPQLQHDLFTVPGDGKGLRLLPQIYAAGGSFFVCARADRERPDLSAFPGEKEDLFDSAVEAKRGRLMREWLAYRRSHSKVQLNPAVFGTRLGPG